MRRAQSPRLHRGRCGKATDIELAFGLAVGLVPAETPGALRAILGAAELATKDPIAVGAAVLPGDKYPLRARLIDRSWVFRCHFRSLGPLRKQSISLLRCYGNQIDSVPTRRTTHGHQGRGAAVEGGDS